MVARRSLVRAVVAHAPNFVLSFFMGWRGCFEYPFPSIFTTMWNATVPHTRVDLAAAAAAMAAAPARFHKRISWRTCQLSLLSLFAHSASFASARLFLGSFRSPKIGTGRMSLVLEHRPNATVGDSRGPGSLGDGIERGQDPSRFDANLFHGSTTLAEWRLWLLLLGGSHPSPKKPSRRQEAAIQYLANGALGSARGGGGRRREGIKGGQDATRFQTDLFDGRSPPTDGRRRRRSDRRASDGSPKKAARRTSPALHDALNAVIGHSRGLGRCRNGIKGRQHLSRFHADLFDRTVLAGGCNWPGACGGGGRRRGGGGGDWL